MRIYELSKELNTTSKNLIEALHKAGIAAKSHMSAIDDKAVALLRKKFMPPKTQVQEKKDSIKKSKDNMQKESASRPSISSKPQAPKKPTVQPAPRKISEKIVEQAPTEPIGVVIEPMLVSDVAEKLDKPVNEVILTLLKWRILAAKNQQLAEEVIERLVKHYGATILKKEAALKEEFAPLEKEGEGELKERKPVVVVLGHVDHGKTTLLDFVRKTRVVAREKGGITQHLGAYEAGTDHGNLIFLDTPGHEAFPKMRQRGIKVADIGILVVAADDGIMPQTVEAIKQLKSMQVPILVAINKIDKADKTRVEVIKRQLAEHDLLPEEWGGETICIPISALTGEGVDQLLEMIALQSQLLELRASHQGLARCYVLESKLEKGRGPVATIICQHGMLKLGDYFVCGQTTGRVSSIKNSNGKMLTQAGPSIPVQVAGFKDIPEAGDLFKAIQKADIRSALQEQNRKTASGRQHSDGGINILVKADTNSSKEAVLDAIQKLSKKSDVGFNVIHSGVGDVSESDIELAYSTGTSIIGLHVKTETNALSLAQRRKVTVHLFDIIYKLLESLEEQAEKAKDVEMVRTKIGEAIVRAVFDIKGVGVIAGSYVQDGRFAKNGYVEAWRGKEKIGEGPITSLQREKKNVKEVHAGYECGFVVEGITDWLVDDRVECFIDEPKK